LLIVPLYELLWMMPGSAWCRCDGGAGPSWIGWAAAADVGRPRVAGLGLAWCFGVRELADPGGILLVELALKIIQQVTVAVIQH
jgi:hypothetical protein